MLNKKGEDPQGFSVGLLMGLILLAVVAAGIWLVYNNATGAIKAVTIEEKQIAGQACQYVVGSLEDNALYCAADKKIKLAGVSQYASCAYLATIIANNTWAKQGVVCGDDSAIIKCKELVEAEIATGGIRTADAVKINGMACSNEGLGNLAESYVLRYNKTQTSPLVCSSGILVTKTYADASLQTLFPKSTCTA